jgi:hypothetical protein
MESISDSVSQA